MRSKFRAALVSAAAALLVTTTAGYAAASVSTDRWLYQAGETVQITGDEMWPGELVTVEVTYPDGSSAQVHEVVADAGGMFSDTYTLPMDAPGGIYGLTATGQDSGNVFATTFDPPSPTTTTLSLSTNSITYGSGVTLSGRVTKDSSGGGVPSAPVNLTVSNVDCSATGSALGSATGSAGQPASAGNWSWPSTGDWNPTAGTWYVKATYPGLGGENEFATSFDCETLVVAKASTTTSITNSPDQSFGLGSTLSVDYLVESERGVSGNTTGGAVAISQASGPTDALCGAQASASDTLSVDQSDADGTGVDPVGFEATGDLTCVPSQVGTYTYRIVYSGDSNYLGSQSSPDQALEVTTVTLEVCRAAPAIAVEHLTSLNVKPGSRKWRDVVTTIAGETGSQGDFHARNACDTGYADAVRNRVGQLVDPS